MNEEESIRFFSKVNFNGPNGCWVWESSVRDGYGAFGIDRIIYGAHRVSYEHFYCQIPEGLQVQHKCHNRKCVNPIHLKLGDHQDNSNDKLSAGRQSKGESHGRSKLTRDDIDSIRKSAQVDHVNQCDLADIYGVSQCQISYIVRHKQWKS